MNGPRFTRIGAPVRSTLALAGSRQRGGPLKSISAIFCGVIGAVLGFIAGSYIAVAQFGLYEKWEVLRVAIPTLVLGAVSAVIAVRRWRLATGRMQVALMGVLAAGLMVVFLKLNNVL
jgi:hypothetical protein